MPHQEKKEGPTKMLLFKGVNISKMFFLAFLVLIYSYFVWATVYFIQNSGESYIVKFFAK